MKRSWHHYVAFILNLPIIRSVTPAKWYLLMRYYERFHYMMDFKNPIRFNEKLQWLKIYNRKPEYTMWVDKFSVRKYISNKLGEEYLIPLVGGPWNSVEEIDFAQLPQQFVLKCTHDSASTIICTDKNKFDIVDACSKLRKCLKYNFYWYGREWPYKNVKPQIIAEQYMVDESGTELKDYKIFCFSGEPKLIQVNLGRFAETGPINNIYDCNWKYMPIKCHYPTNPHIKIEKPQELSKMLDFARILSKDQPFLRVDFYSINEKIYFGELTFFPASGFSDYEPDEWNDRLGSWVKLP